MDYSRIYREFIADRMDKQPVKPAYSERHHIVPVSLGGSDEPVNLIRLTPEDHFFAHLLLAKIYGGSMWVALHAMAHLTAGIAERRGCFRRKMFGYVRANLAAYYRSILSGPNGKIADKTVRELRSFSGKSVKGNRFELEAMTGVTRQQISALFQGAKMSAHGWYCPLNNPKGLTPKELLRQRLMKTDRPLMLFHHDGRTFIGHKFQFREQFGFPFSPQVEGAHVGGWYDSADGAAGHYQRQQAKRQHAADSRGSISGAANPRADKTIHRFQRVSDGEVFHLTRVELKQRFGVPSANISQLMSGKQKIAKGFRLVQ